MVGVVDGVDLGAEGAELCVPVFLDGAGFLACLFEFDEAVVSSGEDDESVGEADHAVGVEFEAHAAVFFGGVFEGFFDCFFLHWSYRFWGGVGQVRGVFYIGLEIRGYVRVAVRSAP